MAPDSINTNTSAAQNGRLSEQTSRSLDSFLDRHLYEDGRRYHVYREGKYSLPNDEIEQQREEILHMLVIDILRGQLFLSPMQKSPAKIMDLATGIGIWAIEMGDRYPDATILGIDLSPIQPTSVPPNVSFQIDDVEDTWVHDDDYDFIHMRESCAYMRSTPTVIENSFHHLRPGGWLEIQEFHWEAVSENGTAMQDNPVNAYLREMYAYGQSEGREIPIVPKLGELMRQAGFVNIQKRMFKVPYGSWHQEQKQKRRGTYLAATCEILLPSCDRLLSTIGLSPEQIETLFGDISAMFHEGTVQSYATYYVWSGQKPNQNGTT